MIDSRMNDQLMKAVSSNNKTKIQASTQNNVPIQQLEWFKLCKKIAQLTRVIYILHTQLEQMTFFSNQRSDQSKTLDSELRLAKETLAKRQQELEKRAIEIESCAVLETKVPIKANALEI